MDGDDRPGTGASGPLDRRRFLRLAGTAGVGLSALAPLLAACGRRDRPEDAAAGDLGPLEPELNVYNWSDYVAPDTIAGFEREFGVRVTYDTYESNEEMVAKLMSGATGYDLVVPSGYLVPVMQAAGLLAPLHPDRLPNLANLAPLFAGGVRGPSSAPDGAYAVPWQWGTTGIAYRRDRLPEAPEGWAAFFDARHRGRMTMMDDGREVIGAMLKYRGRSLNSTDPAELEQARIDALRAKPNLKAYVSAPVKAQLIAGDVLVAQLWNGDAAQARREQPEIAFALPKEGSLIWTDYLVVPSAAPHKRAAHEFINYVLRPEVGAAVSNATGYGSPNAAAAPLITDPIPYPTEAELARLEYQHDLGEATAVWDRVWTEIKAG